MKKMTFLSIMPLLFIAPLLLSAENPTWAPRQHRESKEEQQHRIKLQKKALYLPNISRSPSPQPRRNIIPPRKRQSPAPSVINRL